MRKKRVLLVNEASYLSTGYAIFGRQLLEGLYNSGKYEIGEFGTFGSLEDPRSNNIPWVFYANSPDQFFSESDFNADYNNNVFGKWKFEHICLDFKPDIVSFLNDPYHHSWAFSSPLRPYYNLSIIATLDSRPLQEDWIQMYCDADAMFSYSRYGYNGLMAESNGKMHMKGITPYCPDSNVFKPVQDKKKHKEQFGLKDDVFIIGMVSRNQQRKLYPDLLNVFRDYLSKVDPEIAKKSFLYLHTCALDNGWDFPRILKASGVANKVLFTYVCRNCGIVHPSLFIDHKNSCRRCGSSDLMMPNSQFGVDEESLCSIYNLFDACIQYSISEGLSMTCLEAASCGIPLLVHDFSALEDYKDTVGAIPIKTKRMFCEPASHFWRAYPDDDDAVARLVEIAQTPDFIRNIQGMRGRNLYIQNYNKNQVLQTLMDAFDELPEPKKKWNTPIQLHESMVPEVMQKNIQTDLFVKLGLNYVAGRSDLIGSYVEAKYIRDLNVGRLIDHTSGPSFSEMSLIGTIDRFPHYDREQALKDFIALANEKNKWEKIRGQKCH